MYLGIDIGTSAVKVCVLSENRQVVATRSAPLHTHHPFDGASEQDPDDWWTATTLALTQLEPGLRGAVCAIGLSGQMHGAVLLDRAQNPLCPAILWNDTRASAECAAMLDENPDIGILAGALPMPGFTAPKLRWLARHAPELYGQIRHILLPKDYIGLILHGNLVTDPSDAAGTSWFDQKTGAWSETLCNLTLTRMDWLPTVMPGYDIAGRLRPAPAEILGLPQGIPVVAGAGDAAAGAVGIGAVAEGDSFLSLGTSGQLFAATADYRPNPESRIHAYAHTVPGMWFQMAAMLNGARPIAWLAGLLARPIPDLLQAAETAAPGPIFLPYLTGERTPHGDGDIRAGFALLGETTDQGALMRAVVEAVAFSFADAFDALACAGTSPRHVLSIGGGTRSNFVMQTIADATGCALACSSDADIGPALGAARLAALGANSCAISDWATKPQAEVLFEPRTDQQAAMIPRLNRYRALYPALKQVQQAP